MRTRDAAPCRRVADELAASTGLGAARLDLVNKEICFNGNQQSSARRPPTPAGPNAAVWLPTSGRTAAKFWWGGDGEGEGKGVPGPLSPSSCPLPGPPRPSPPTHQPSAPTPDVPCHSTLPLLPWPQEQELTPLPDLLEAGTEDGGPPPSWPHPSAGTLASLGLGFLMATSEGVTRTRWDDPHPGRLAHGRRSTTLAGVNRTSAWMTGWHTASAVWTPVKVAELVGGCPSASQRLGHPTPSLSPLRTPEGRLRLRSVHLPDVRRGPAVGRSRPVPARDSQPCALHSVTSCRWLKMSHGASIYTTETGNCFKAGPFS